MEWQGEDWRVDHDEWHGTVHVRHMRHRAGGPGAHRIEFAGGPVLWVLPDGATSARKRLGALLVAIAASEGRSSLSREGETIRELQRVGAYRFAIEDEDGRLVNHPRVRRIAESKARVLDALGAAGERGISSWELARLAGHRFGARLRELRQGGWPIVTEHLGGREYRYTLGDRS